VSGTRKRVAVLPGDGIGPEVVDVALPVLDRLGMPVEPVFGEIGWECWRTGGDPVPEATWRLIDETDTCLLGAITSKPHREAEAELPEHLRGTGRRYVSPVIQLRQRLGLYANLRPVENHTGSGRPFRFCVIRENSEGLYAGYDWHGLPEQLAGIVGDHPNVAASAPGDVTASLRLQTGHGVDRLLRYGFGYARAHGHRRLTVADKPNVLRASGDFVRTRLEAIAAEYPDVEHEILNVDALALWLVRRPERFGVVVAENMFGDILSDLSAGVMGGLGLAPSANVGSGGGYFEPVHGSAPPLAGRDRANPAAMFLTIGLMLEHLGFAGAAREVGAAVKDVVRRGTAVTYDLGGQAGTKEMAAALLDACGDRPPARTASVVTIGDELLRGDVVDSNAAEASRMLTERGYTVRERRTVPDDLRTITTAVREGLGRDALVLVMGGLGPTSDDLTRFGVAQALELPLVHREEAWTAVVERLRRFDIAVHEDNRRQALMPEGAQLLPNPNGTAMGARAQAHGTEVLMLPGPPKECLPMLRATLGEPAEGGERQVSWRTLGLIEADAAAAVDEVLREAAPGLRPAFRWHYPYVDVKLSYREADFPDLAERVGAVLAGHVVSRRERTAVEELAAVLDGREVIVVDRVTEGAFLKVLQSLRDGEPEPLDDGDGTPADGDGGELVRLVLDGEWRRGARDVHSGSLDLSATVTTAGGHSTGHTLTLPNRGPEVIDGAVEFAAWSLLRALETPPPAEPGGPAQQTKEVTP
jgi:isocitrate dehydrogenase